MSDPVTLDPHDLDGDPVLALWRMENDARMGQFAPSAAGVSASLRG